MAAGRVASGAQAGARPGAAGCGQTRAPILLAPGASRPPGRETERSRRPSRHPRALTPPVEPRGRPRTPRPPVARRLRARRARSSSPLLQLPRAGKGAVRGGGERSGSHLVAGVQPRGKTRDGGGAGAPTPASLARCGPRALWAVGSAVGQLRTPRGRCWQLSGEPSAAQCREEGQGERVGWGEGREEPVAARARPPPLGDRSRPQQRTPAPRAATQVTGAAAGNAAARGRGPGGRREMLGKEDGPLACGEAESPEDPSRKAAPLLQTAVSYSAPTSPPWFSDPGLGTGVPSPPTPRLPGLCCITGAKCYYKDCNN